MLRDAPDAAALPTRRTVVGVFGLTGIAALAAACAAPAAPSPTAAPAAPAPKPTTPPQPTAKPAASEPPKPAATAAPKAAATTAPAKPATLARWKYGTFAANLQDTPFYYGIEKGWFAEQGIEIEITNLTSDVTAMQGLAAGEFDFISLNLLGEIALIAGGAPLKVLGSNAAGLNQITAATKAISNPRDLAGKTLGHSGPGSLPDIIIDLILDKYGVDPATVTKVNAGATPARLAALLENKVDAAQLTLDDMPRLQAEGQLNIISVNAEDLPDYVTAGFAVAEKSLADRRPQVEGLLTGTARSVRALYEQRDEAVRVMAGKLARDPGVVGPAFDLYLKYRIWPRNLDLTAQQIDYMQGINIKLNRQQQRLPAERIVDFSVRDKVLATLGR